MQEGNGREETDSTVVEDWVNQIGVKLVNLGTVNKNRVTISNGGKSVDLYFSYQTLVAVNNVVSKNEWSVTTNKLLNELEPNKDRRVPHEEVLKVAQEKLKEVLA